MCLLIGRGTVVGALLWILNFLHGRHCTLYHAQHLFFAVSAMNVDDIDAHSRGAVVNFQCSDGTIVSAKILGPSKRANYRSITYERSSTVVTHVCAPVAPMCFLCVRTPTTHLCSHNGQPGGEKANWEEGAVEVGRFFAPIILPSH